MRELKCFQFPPIWRTGCLPYLVPVLSFCGRVNLLDSAMCRINDHTRPPMSLCSDTLPSHKPCRQPSNDRVSFPTTLILGKRHLGWWTCMLWILKRHLLYSKLINSIILAYILIFDGLGLWSEWKINQSILDVHRCGLDHKRMLSMSRADSLGGPARAASLPAHEPSLLPSLLLLLGHHCTLGQGPASWHVSKPS